MDWRTGVGIGIGLALSPWLTDVFVKRPARFINNYLWKKLPENSVWRKILLTK